MRYFDIYSSNTTGATGNQRWFSAKRGGAGRVFYKVRTGGEFDYSLLYSNIVDSTYAKGAISYKNLLGDEYELSACRIGVCAGDFFNNGIEAADLSSVKLRDVTFDGRAAKRVAPGEFFSTDPVRLRAEAGDYICVEVEFRGPRIPYHEEIQLASYVRASQGWRAGNRMPIPSMVGCARDVRRRVAFWGDSITQGIGTTFNAYAHWAAKVSEQLSDDIACWDIGLGYGRAEDAASGSAWLYKAVQNDLVVVCFGVNDLYHGDPGALIHNLDTIVRLLKRGGCRVLMQTIPPFDYPEALRKPWLEANEFIKRELAARVDAVFDNVPVLGKGPAEPWAAKYGGHPDDEGCIAWANALAPVVKSLL